MQTRIDDRAQPTNPKRASRRPRLRPQAAQPDEWQRDQDRMVGRILDHALAGGADRAGPGADAEQAVDAYLEVLRRDLLAFAARGG